MIRHYEKSLLNQNRDAELLEKISEISRLPGKYREMIEQMKDSILTKNKAKSWQ